MVEDEPFLEYCIIAEFLNPGRLCVPNNCDSPMWLFSSGICEAVLHTGIQVVSTILFHTRFARNCEMTREAPIEGEGGHAYSSNFIGFSWGQDAQIIGTMCDRRASRETGSAHSLYAVWKGLSVVWGERRNANILYNRTKWRYNRRSFVASQFLGA